MTASDFPSARRALPVQFGLAAAVLAVLPLLPPDRGTLLLLPILPGASATRAAVNGGALPLGQGPIEGSVVVVADEPRFAWRMLRAGLLPLSGAAAGCGDVPETQS